MRVEHPAPATRIEAFLNSHQATINDMKGASVILAALLFAIPRELAAQFEYDSTRPFDVACEPLTISKKKGRNPGFRPLAS
jgi:hypothetical protein